MRKLFFVIGFSFFVPLFTFAQVADKDVQPSCANITHTLKLGSKDVNTTQEVTALQTYLAQMNFLSIKPTGYFGRATKKAVQDFQKAHGIAPLGNVGPATRIMIKQLSCPTFYIQHSSSSDTQQKKVDVDSTTISENSADFTATPSKGLPPLAVTFTTTYCTHGVGSGYELDFGDGSAVDHLYCGGNQQNTGYDWSKMTPTTTTHKYTKGGVYTAMVKKYSSAPGDAGNAPAVIAKKVISVTSSDSQDTSKPTSVPMPSPIPVVQSSFVAPQ